MRKHVLAACACFLPFFERGACRAQSPRNLEFTALVARVQLPLPAGFGFKSVATWPEMKTRLWGTTDFKGWKFPFRGLEASWKVAFSAAAEANLARLFSLRSSSLRKRFVFMRRRQNPTQDLPYGPKFGLPASICKLAKLLMLSKFTPDNLSCKIEVCIFALLGENFRSLRNWFFIVSKDWSIDGEKRISSVIWFLFPTPNVCILLGGFGHFWGWANLDSFLSCKTWSE